MSGDFNAHRSLWGSTKDDKRGKNDRKHNKGT